MRLKFLYTTFIILICQSHFLAAQNQKNLKKIDREILRISKEKNIPSLDVNIHSASDSLIINYNHPDLQPQSIYNIGSTTKLLSSVLVFSLIEDGKLNLSDKVITYVDHPGLHDIAGFSELEIENLLRHSSGLSDYTKNPQWIQDVIADNTPQSFDDKISLSDKVLNKQGSFIYSNTNYLLLEMVIEKITGKSFQEVFNQFYAELGLDQISLSEPEKPLESFFAVDDKNSSNVSNWEEHYGLDGGAYATVKSLHDFMHQLFIKKSILDEETLSMMQNWIPMAPMEIPIGKGKIYQYGYGIMKLEYEGDIYIGHAGGTLKNQSFLFFNEENQTTISMLTNCSGRFYNKVFYQEMFPAVLKNL